MRMDANAPDAVAHDVLVQLQKRNKLSSGFKGIVEDYQRVLRQYKEQEVRKGQLEKESRELRAENAVLQEHVEQAKHAAQSGEKVVAAESRNKELQEELTATYKEKSRLAEELVLASRQLQIVRDSNEAQARELVDLTNKGKELRVRIKELNEALENEQSATALATAELQTRLDEKEAAESRATKSESEVSELSKRLVEIKMGEADRINKVNQMCEEMLRNARQMERAAAAREASTSGRFMGRFQSLPAGSVSNMVNGLVEKTRGHMSPVSIESIVPDAPLRTVSAHEGGAYTLAFDRSGVRVASGGADKVVRLWDPISGQQTGVLHGMTETVTEVAFTCDAKHVLASGADQAVRMWDVSSGRVRHTLTGHSQKVCSVDCSPTDAHRAVSGATDRCIKVWDLGRGFCTNTLPCHSSVNAVRITVDSTMVVSGHFDGTLRFWDLRSARLANEVTGLHTQQITSVAVGLRTGVVLTCGKDNLLKLTDWRSFQVQRTLRAPGFHVGGVWCRACIGADEHHAAAGSADGTLHIWSMDKQGHLVKTLRATGSQSILASAWSPQGSPLVSCDKAGAVTFWAPAESGSAMQQQAKSQFVTSPKRQTR